MSEHDQEHKRAIVQHGKDVAMEVGMEMVKEGLQEALEVGAGPVAGIVKAGAAVWSIFNIRKFAKYLGDLALELDCNDPDSLRQLIQEQGDKEWVTEGLDRGFRKIMEATDPVAKKCILVMVADYLKRKSLPDRTYRQIGSLFIESDEQMLHLIYRIGVKIKGHTQGGVFAFREHNSTGARFGVAGHKGAFEADTSAEDLGPCEEPELIHTTCDALIRTGFASAWYGDPTDVVRSYEWPGSEILTQLAKIEFNQNMLLETALQFMSPVLSNPPRTGSPG
ncbi:hypothetical protein OV203_26140 [Nannocystis sp. ILAH1]|uniref:hypothetical protein n=1 Tax=Nannocystis sp. ILAH1 TaxID=2996789 RepID=UPI00226DFBD1|nr:hypothetical protein [Nannocystis sp. ILAH1]MCY0990651.1 hypothetical protein [Nannocystis sp. ILAH1]